MAHHHHPHNTSPQPISRPLLLRILSILALILPPILFLISMSLTLATIYNPHYSRSALYNSTGQPNGIVISASPFYTCDRVPTETIDDISTYNQTCQRTSFLGNKGMKACIARFKPGFDDTQICQKVIASASLYVAGAVLVGLATLFSVIYLALAAKSALATTEPVPGYAYTFVPSKSEGSETTADAASATPYSTSNVLVSILGSVTTFLALLATGCLVLAQIVGVQALVNEQHPTAGESPEDGVMGRWYMGTPAYVWSSVAWLSATIGVFVAVAGRIARR